MPYAVFQGLSPGQIAWRIPAKVMRGLVTSYVCLLDQYTATAISDMLDRGVPMDMLPISDKTMIDTTIGLPRNIGFIRKDSILFFVEDPSAFRAPENLQLLEAGERALARDAVLMDMIRYEIDYPDEPEQSFAYEIEQRLREYRLASLASRSEALTDAILDQIRERVGTVPMDGFVASDASMRFSTWGRVSAGPIDDPVTGKKIRLRDVEHYIGAYVAAQNEIAQRGLNEILATGWSHSYPHFNREEWLKQWQQEVDRNIPDFQLAV